MAVGQRDIGSGTDDLHRELDADDVRSQGEKSHVAMGGSWRASAAPVLGTLSFLALLEFTAQTGIIDSRLVPAPTEIAVALFGETRSAEFWVALADTLRGWALGLGLAIAIAVPVGIVVGSNLFLYRSLRFLIDFFRPIPSIAILPLFMLVLGIEPALKIYITALAAFWPMFFQTVYGVQDVDPVARDTARSYRLSPFMRFIFVSVPGATPFIATGLRLSASIALLVVVGTEMVVGLTGLGREIITAQYAGQITRMYSFVFVSGLLGILIAALFTKVERRTLSWHPSQRKERAT